MRFSWQTLTLGGLVALATFAVSSPRAAQGQTFTWNNATGNWSDGTKWVGGVAPVIAAPPFVLPPTLIANPFVANLVPNWIDPIPARGGDWRLSLQNNTLMETSGPVPNATTGLNTGTFDPTILLQNTFTTPATYSYNASMRTNDDDGLGIVFGYQPNGDYFRASLRQQTGSNTGHTSGVSVQKVIGGVATQLNPASGVAGPAGVTQAMIDARTTFNLRVEVTGNNYEVFFNNVSKAVGSDAALAAGKVGVYSWAQAADLTTTTPFWGTEVNSVTVTDGAVMPTTLFTENFTTVALPVSFNDVYMKNAAGIRTNLIGAGASTETMGNFGHDLHNAWIRDNNNGNRNAASPANTDFISPATMVDDPGATALDDYELRVRLATNDNDGIGVLVRVQDQDNFYRINFLSDTAAAGTGRPFRGMSVQKSQSDGFGNNVWTNLFDESTTTPLFIPPFAAGDPSSSNSFDVSVKVNGNAINVQVVTAAGAVIDYPQIVDASTPLLTGSVGFTQWGNAGSYWTNYGGVPGPLVVEYAPPPPQQPQHIFGADTVNFGGAGPAYTSTFDGDDGSPVGFFMINKLNLASNVSGSVVGILGTWPGIEKLGFAGPNPEINMTGTGDMTLAMPIMPFENLTINVAASAGKLHLGPTPDANGMLYQGLGTVTINNLSGTPVELSGIGDFDGTLNIAAGQVSMTQPGGSVLGALTINIASGATFLLNGNDEEFGALTGAGTFDLGTGYIQMTQMVDQDWSGSIIGTGVTHGTAAPFGASVSQIFSNGRDTNWTWRGDNTYVGETDFRGGGTVRLVDGGRISGTSDSTDADTTAITIMRTELILDNTGTANNNDRLNDTAEINLIGGLTLLGRANTATTETVGAINMQTAAGIAGQSVIGQPPRAATITVVNGTGTGTATLTIASLSRTATVGSNIDFAGNGTVVITTAPTLLNGIIGGWATKGNDWATIAGDGSPVVQLASYETSTSPADWDPTDNVKITGAPSANVDLTVGDKTINSLNFASNQTVTLDGFATLFLDSGGLLASTSGTITGAFLSAASQQGNAAELRTRVNGPSNVLTIGSTISGTIGLSKTGDGVLKLTATNSFVGTVLIDGGVVEISDVSALGSLANDIIFSDGTLRLAANVDLTRTGLTRGQGDIIFDTQGFQLTTTSIGGYGSVIKKGSGTWILNTTNSLDGDVTILEGMAMSAAGGVGSLFDTTTILHVAAGATFDFNDNVDTGGLAAIEGDGTINTGASPTTNLLLSGTESRGPVMVFNGKITGAGNVVISTYPFKQSFGGASEYTGTTSFVNGGLIITANALVNTNGPLGNGSSAIQLGDGGGLSNITFEIGVAGVTVARDISVNVGDMISVGGIHATGTSTFSGGVSLAKTLYVTAAGTSTVAFTGNVVDAGGTYSGALIKIGSGTVTLSGANTYTGETYVADGKLLVNGTNSGTGKVTVATDGTLGGTGTIAGPVTVYGTLAPGASIGTLSVSANVILNGTLSAEVSGASIDKLAVTGGLTLGASSVLDIQGTLNGAVTYVIASYNAGTLVGTFADALDATTHGYNVVYNNTQIILDELDGDANHDGVVDIFDINLVSANWNPAGPVGTFATGNINHDTSVDIFDINLISSNWAHVATNGGPAHAQAVPEPSSMIIALVGLLGLVGVRGFRLRRKVS